LISTGELIGSDNIVSMRSHLINETQQVLALGNLTFVFHTKCVYYTSKRHSIRLGVHVNWYRIDKNSGP